MNRFAWLFVGLLAWGLSFGQAKADIETPVLIYVTVPEDATLEVDGVVVNQKGAERKLITDYKLKIGQKVSYTLSAKFNRDGKPVVVSKVVTVEGGVESRVDLTKVSEVVIPKKEEPKTVLPKVEPKKEEPKKEEPKKVEPKKEEMKKEEPKKVEPKKEEPKKVEPKKEEPKKVEPKKEEPKKVEPKKEEPKKEPTPAKKEIRLDVPYVPTPEKVVDEMLKLANVTDKDVVYDLGCGDGRIFISAVKKYNAKKGIGLDLNPVRVKESKDNAQKAGVTDKVEIREGDVLKITDLSEASVVTLYLLPDINVKLKPILKKSLKPGSRIVSHDFDMGDDWKPEKEITVKDETGREHTIYLWTIPGAKKEEPKKVEAPKKTEEPKKVEPKKTEEPKKVEPKKTEEPKKVEPKKTEEPKKVKARLDVPYVPTPQSVVDEMLKLGGVKEGDVVYDLGCGDGRIVVTATKKFNAKKGVGVDIDPERIAECHANAKAANVQNKVEFREGDVLKITDVSEASVVMLYLFPEVNEKLQPMLQKTLKPGSRIVSHDFLMQDNWEPEKQINIKDASGQEHTLYLWVIPTKK